ncbi:DUF2752 domain-containing protein [Ornithobacterium rhinotracheale]
MKKTLKIIIISSALLLGGALLFIYSNYNPSKFDFFPQCPSYTCFHLYCPGCGTQRAIFQLLNFNFKEAFLYNPLMVILLPLVVYAAVLKVLNFILGTHYRVKLFNNSIFIKALLVLVLIYFMARNVEIPGFEFLRPPQ